MNVNIAIGYLAELKRFVDRYREEHEQSNGDVYARTLLTAAQREFTYKVELLAIMSGDEGFGRTTVDENYALALEWFEQFESKR